MINKKLTSSDISVLEIRASRAIEKFNIKDLMEYDINSTSGCDIEDFYREVIQETLIEEVFINAAQISYGKYEITFEFENKDRWYISSYAWDDTEIILNNLMDNVILPHLKRPYKKYEKEHIA